MALAAMAAAALLSGCGERKPNGPGPSILPPLPGPIAFTRADSTALEMGDSVRICCGPWDAGYIDRTALKVLVYDPAGLKGGWKLFLLPGETMANTAYTLPTAPSGPSSQAPVNLFAVDFDGRNQVNSDESESRGTITVHALSCGPPARVDVSIDAVLGSELGGAPEVRVWGRFQATGSPGDSCDFGL
jgi:hypothetical protein